MHKDANSSINGKDEVLCCCEFIDRSGQRRHILEVCCDCEDLDDTCERLITKSDVPAGSYETVLMLISDRLRIPCCCGQGAMKINLDMILPIILVPTMILIGALGPWWTVVSFITIPIICYYLYVCHVQRNPRSRFFLAWSLCSLAFLMGVMEVEVLPYLEIYLYENILHKLFVAGMLLCVYFVKKDPGVLETNSSNVMLALDDPEDVNKCTVCDIFQIGRAGHCRLCNACILQRDHHCVWIDSCVGARNHRAFLLGLIFLILSTFYGSSLTLTTICQPVMIWDIYLLPQDCTGVYDSIHLGVCFVSAIYAVVITLAALCALFHQLYLISINMTVHEWRVARRKDNRKTFCKFFQRSFHSKGFLVNWYKFCHNQR